MYAIFVIVWLMKNYTVICSRLIESYIMKKILVQLIKKLSPYVNKKQIK